MNLKRVQQRLADLGFDPGKIDGKNGPKTKAAIKAFQKSSGLRPDGILGPRTLDALFPPEKPIAASSDFDKMSAQRLSKAHPSIQIVMNEARKYALFTILDSQRGKRAQEAAYKAGFSKAHFGQSPHNWTPAIAVDCAPIPLDWKNLKAFDHLASVILPIANQMNVPLRWGGDWNMDGSTADGWDKPHYELHPWRVFAKQAKPYTP